MKLRLFFFHSNGFPARTYGNFLKTLDAWNLEAINILGADLSSLGGTMDPMVEEVISQVAPAKGNAERFLPCLGRRHFFHGDEQPRFCGSPSLAARGSCDAHALIAAERGTAGSREGDARAAGARLADQLHGAMHRDRHRAAQLHCPKHTPRMDG